MASECQNLERKQIMRRVALLMLISSATFCPPANAVTNLTLEEAIEMALEKNRTILIQREEIEKAEARIVEARANFFPTFSLSGGYTRLAEVPEFRYVNPAFDTVRITVFDDFGNPIGYTYADRIVGVTRTTFKMGAENGYMGRFSLQQPIFTWGRIRNGYELAKLNSSATQEDYRKIRNETIFRVEEAFYTILFLEEFITSTEESYEQMKRHVSVVQKRYDAGLASKFDLIRARVQLANMEPQVLKARDGLRMARNGLQVLLGVPLDEEIELKGQLEYAPASVNLDTAMKEALARRPELIALELKKKMAERALAIAAAANKPNLGFVMNYSYQKPYNFEDEWGGSWDATLALQLPLFDGGATSGKIKQAGARLNQAEIGLQMFTDVVSLEVRNALLQLTDAARLAQSQEENVKLAEEALRIAERRYENGLMTSLEVIDAQLALAQAKTNYLQTLSDYSISRSKLKRAVGGGN